MEQKEHQINPGKLRQVKLVFIIFLIAVVGLQLYKLYWPKATVSLAGQTLHVLVADNSYRHYKGLGGRKELAPYDGMMFLFGLPGKFGFVMRDTLFPIDIVWLAGGQVVDIAPRVQPEPGVAEADLRRYYPRLPATVVLELPAGWSEKYGLKIGGTLRVLD